LRRRHRPVCECALPADASPRSTNLAGRFFGRKYLGRLLGVQIGSARERRRRMLRRSSHAHGGLQIHQAGDEAVNPRALRTGRFDFGCFHGCADGCRSLRPAHRRASTARVAESAPLTARCGAGKQWVRSWHPASRPSGGLSVGERHFLSVLLASRPSVPRAAPQGRRAFDFIGLLRFPGLRRAAHNPSVVGSIPTRPTDHVPPTPGVKPWPKLPSMSTH
jgi:hypothetical protein